MKHFISLLLAVTPIAFGAAPPLREQVSLNGTWDGNETVPVYESIQIDQKRYARTVEVPASWAGKVIRVEFENVAFIADVSVNGKHLVQHIGAWNPFAVDVSDLVKPGGSFRLTVDVKGPKHQPIVDANGAPAWPVGGWFSSSKGGIAGDVWLRAYGAVHIEDAFIQTSVRRKELALEYTLRNASKRPRTVKLEIEAVSGKQGAPVPFHGPTVTLAAGETKVVKAAFPWANPMLWWPDDPVLYHLKTRLLEGAAIMDAETRRFGFREIWTEGNQFRFNGIRANLYGDYQVFGDTWYTQPVIHMPAHWPATVDKIKAMNIRVMRWHHNPVPQYLLDVSDEKGLLICDEAANYARNYHAKSDKRSYLANTHRWIEAWIKADRNHPSVYMWNATNEMSYSFAGPFDSTELRKFGDTIRKFDETRPIGYDGDHMVEDSLIDYHLSGVV